MALDVPHGCCGHYPGHHGHRHGWRIPAFHLPGLLSDPRRFCRCLLALPAQPGSAWPGDGPVAQGAGSQGQGGPGRTARRGLVDIQAKTPARGRGPKPQSSGRGGNCPLEVTLWPSVVNGWQTGSVLSPWLRRAVRRPVVRTAFPEFNDPFWFASLCLGTWVQGLFHAATKMKVDVNTRHACPNPLGCCCNIGQWPEKCRSNAPSLAATTSGR